MVMGGGSHPHELELRRDGPHVTLRRHVPFGPTGAPETLRGAIVLRLDRDGRYTARQDKEPSSEFSSLE